MMFVLVFAISCHVSENLRTGPVNSQITVDAASIANTSGRPDARAV
jgi:hypothetical protein